MKIKEINENKHLIISKKWFDMIQDGDKKEDYRKLNAYWFKKFVFNPEFVCRMFGKDVKTLTDHDVLDLIVRPIFLQMCPFVPLKTITFRNGIGKGSREMVVECNDIKFRTGNPAWGAKDEVVYITIELGKILSTQTYNHDLVL